MSALILPLGCLLGVGAFWLPSALARAAHPDEPPNDWDQQMDSAMLGAVIGIVLFWGGGYALTQVFP